jgi:hypothetical protein
VVFTDMKDRVTQAMMDLINKERDGGAVDRALLRKCVEIFEAMGEGTLEVYTEAFQVGCTVPTLGTPQVFTVMSG